ncbi:MAG: DUF1593 domain-containing protein [Cyclobacteriaceae bacterium]
MVQRLTKIILQVLTICCLLGCTQPETSETPLPRVLISSDIGGTDPDDFQSMIHAFMYLDQYQLEGLISSPYGPGRKQDILDMIDLYESDYIELSTHSDNYPTPDVLKGISKQGETSLAPYVGYRSSTEGSDWIIQCAKRPSEQPLWILIWGGLEDLAQALHDDPTIKEQIKVYWIGGPNKKWSINAYSYIVQHHSDLWMIEANATYRGWFMDDEKVERLSNKSYYNHNIQGRGTMGDAFNNYYAGEIKMGDTPSLAYVLNGDPNKPTEESWGGSFTPIDRSSHVIFDGNSSITDTVAAYAVLEWRFKGPSIEIPSDSSCFILEIWNQKWPGYYLGDGIYAVRYSPKRPESATYTISSQIPELNNLTSQYVSINPWPGKANDDDYRVGPNWFGDRSETQYFIQKQQGAKTVSKHREAFLKDWATKWNWLK